MDSVDDRYSTIVVGRNWALIPGRASALIDNGARAIPSEWSRAEMPVPANDIIKLSRQAAAR